MRISLDVCAVFVTAALSGCTDSDVVPSVPQPVLYTVESNTFFAMLAYPLATTDSATRAAPPLSVTCAGSFLGECVDWVRLAGCRYPRWTGSTPPWTDVRLPDAGD